MGPSVKFVSAIKDAIFNKKMGVNFFPVIKTKPGGDPRGIWQKTRLFPDFLLPLPVTNDIDGVDVVDIIDIIDVVDVVDEGCEMI